MLGAKAASVHVSPEAWESIVQSKSAPACATTCGRIAKLANESLNELAPATMRTSLLLTQPGEESDPSLVAGAWRHPAHHLPEHAGRSNDQVPATYPLTLQLLALARTSSKSAATSCSQAAEEI